METRLAGARHPLRPWPLAASLAPCNAGAESHISLARRVYKISRTHELVGVMITYASLLDEACTSIVLALDAEMWTMVAACSEASTPSLDDIVTSVLRVTNESSLKGWTNFAGLLRDSEMDP